MNCVIWGGLQSARGDAPIEISCRSLGHGIGIEDENKLGEGTEAGECHSPEVTNRSKHRVARSGNGIEESTLMEGTEAGGVPFARVDAPIEASRRSLGQRTVHY